MEPLAPTPRRSFLQRLAVGTAALLTGGTAAHAAPAARRPIPGARRVGDEWLERIHGSHRQVFDLVEPNRGFGVAYALNYLDSYKDAHGLADDALTAVLVFRHFAMPLAVNDDVWAKYKVGELIHVDDPETEAPATRNVFRANILLRPELTYEEVFAWPSVVATACNLALTVLSSLSAPNAGVTAEEAKADWEAGLLPGVVLAPSGVYAVNRAQEHECTYCYGG